jgi:uncharacterized protein (TIGR00255 family)
MISSMTGFARNAGFQNGVSWIWELKSVNGRGLDVRVRVPPGYEILGEAARKSAAEVLVRGSLNINLMVQSAEATRPSVRLNTDLIAALHDALSALPPDLRRQPVSLDALLQVRGVVEAQETDNAPSEPLITAINASLAAAVTELKRARDGEGGELAGALSRHLGEMERLVDAVENHPQRTPAAIRKRLAEQVTQLLESGPAGLDATRLHQEAALLATRADVREELDRLGAHIRAARELLAAGGAVGRKFDFLAQEFGREASTLCAKANHVEISRIGLDLRTIVDQFREQVQNVE